jgi:hypothetical protein
LKVRSPCCSSVVLPCFISLSNSSTMIFITLDVFF